jgi:hypothetical protein
MMRSLLIAASALVFALSSTVFASCRIRHPISHLAQGLDFFVYFRDQAAASKFALFWQTE